jgi:hypothetical protein
MSRANHDEQAEEGALISPAPVGDSLSNGAAGIALLHIARAQTGTGSWTTAHDWVRTASRAVTAHPEVAGLYRGAPAVAFTLHTADLPSYTPALATLDSHITALTRHRLHAAHGRMGRGELPALREYDLISGLTGIGAYLLHRDRDPDLTRRVLAYLVRLTEPVRIDGEWLPGWWCAHGPVDQPAERWRGGHANLGMAHGVSGVLALLATAMLRGITVAGQAEAIERIAAFLDQWRAGGGRRAWWPERITLDQWRCGHPAQNGPHRPSWCYGTPGLARAQQLAGLALGDPRRARLAEAALAGCLTDTQQLGLLTDASICHGWAGLVHTTWRAAADAGPDGELAALLPGLRARLADYLDQPDQHGPPGEGLLDGAAGVALVQHTQAAGAFTTGWDSCLLVRGSPADRPEHSTIAPNPRGHDEHHRH